MTSQTAGDGARTIGDQIDGNTPQHTIRVPWQLWNAAKAEARAYDLPLVEIIRSFLRWLVHEPGAVLPARPSVSVRLLTNAIQTATTAHHVGGSRRLCDPAELAEALLDRFDVQHRA